jgi:ribosomal protein S18 acetylase RimI-like enzyme
MTSSHIVVRTAGPGDVDAVTALHTEARSAYYLAGGLSGARLGSPEGLARRRRFWVDVIGHAAATVRCAERDGELVGILAIGRPVGADADAGTTAQLYQIDVRTRDWGQGIGSLLHAEFVTFLHDASLTTGLLDVWERNTRALAFYARHGWRPDGHRRPGPCDAGYLRLRLDPVFAPR